ncbi:MAG: hypothetical protein P4L63_03485 [Candidatus Pacebacteria bacterium]|nr:hypothetical protein [Candidatus Paceibacterota bacterium]
MYLYVLPNAEIKVDENGRKTVTAFVVEFPSENNSTGILAAILQAQTEHPEGGSLYLNTTPAPETVQHYLESKNKI